MSASPTFVIWCRRCGGDVPVSFDASGVGEAETFYEDKGDIPAQVALAVDGREVRCSCGFEMLIKSRIWVNVRVEEA